MTRSSRKKKGGGPINCLLKSLQWRFSRDTMWNYKDKSERDPLGTPCHKFQQILIILSSVTRPRTFPTEFQAIAAQLHVHRPGCNARAQEIQRSFTGLVKSGHSRRCLLLPFVRPSSSNVLPSSGNRLTFTSWSRTSVIPSFFACTDAQTCTKPLFVNVTRFFSVFFAVHATAPLSPLLSFDDAFMSGVVCGDFSSRETLNQHRTFSSFSVTWALSAETWRDSVNDEYVGANDAVQTKTRMHVLMMLVEEYRARVK